MKRLLLTAAIAAAMLTAPSIAQQAPVKQAPAAAINPDKMTIGDCLGVLASLQALDGYQVVVNAGKANEQVVTRAYEFGSGKLRGDIAGNMTALEQIRKSAQDGQQAIFKEVAKGELEIKPGSAQNIEYDKQLRAAVARPCDVPLVKIKEADLKLDKNEVPSSVLAGLAKILEK